MTDSAYQASAPYLHLASRGMWEPLRERVRTALVDGGGDTVPDAGTVLDLGAGTGLGTEVALAALPDASVWAVEPSPALRAVLLGRLGDHASGRRVTVFPTDAQHAPLPPRLRAVLALNMAGHLRSDERRALWNRLAAALPAGAPVVVNAQAPATAVAVPEWSADVARQGELTYAVRGSATPTGPDTVRWHLTYTTRHADVVLDRAEATYDWWPASAELLADELRDACLEPVVDDDLVVARNVGPTS